MFVSGREEETFHNLKGALSRTAKGPYSIRMFYPLALRYYEDERTITVLLEPRVTKRSWFDYLPTLLQPFATRASLAVWLDKPLYWDNTEVLPGTPDAVIQDRVEGALREFGLPYVLHRDPPRSTTAPEKVMVLGPGEFAPIREG